VPSLKLDGLKPSSCRADEMVTSVGDDVVSGA
jgi:hypothetical protein